jgi:hypothetical protein
MMLENTVTSKNSKVLIFILLLYNLSYYYFFRPIGISHDLLKAINYLILFVLILNSIKIILGKYNDEFTGFIRFFTIIVFFSIGSAVFNWNQDLTSTIISTIPFFSFLTYFYLVKNNFQIKSLEKMIWGFLIVYLICFYFAFIVAPLRIFEGYGEIGKMIDTSRGLPRIRLTIMSASPLYLAFFMSISNYKKSFQKKWILIGVFLFITIALHLGRQTIFFSLILGILYFIENFRLFKKIILLTSVFFLFFLMTTYIPFLSKLLEKSETEYSIHREGDENIRVGAYEFYLFDVSPNFTTVIIGNGMYSLGKSDYGNYIDKYGRSNGYIPADVGFANVYLLFGLIGLFLFFKLLIRIIFIDVYSEHKYLKYYLVFIFCGSIAGNSLLGSIPLICISLYMLSISHKQKKYVNKIQMLNN